MVVDVAAHEEGWPLNRKCRCKPSSRVVAEAGGDVQREHPNVLVAVAEVCDDGVSRNEYLVAYHLDASRDDDSDASSLRDCRGRDGGRRREEGGPHSAI